MQTMNKEAQRQYDELRLSQSPLVAKDLIDSSACEKMMQRIEALQPGESLIYFQGETGRIVCGDSQHPAPTEAWPLFRMLRSMREGKTATFTQRRLTHFANGVNTFEYIITARQGKN